MNHPLLLQAANEARGLAMDAVHACSSGHLGLPLGSAEIGAVLFGQDLAIDPAEPRWLNRDRFILSAGHGSMFLYGWLHLAGFDLPIEELKNFRQLHSKTPGHPEFGETEGVECTTGPLGQGVANSVGIAISQKMAAARFNTADHTLFDNHVVVLAGDGCLQEGVACEAIALAGHLGLDNLILIYDSNDVTLDAMAEKTQSEDTPARFRACGWDAVTIDGHDLDAIAGALAEARGNNNGRPKLIEAKTLIGKGIPEVAGTAKAHGEGGAKFVEEARKALGLPSESFYVSEEVEDFFAARREEHAARTAAWKDTFAAWKSANPELAKVLEAAVAKRYPEASELFAAIPEFNPGKAVATRGSGGKVLNVLATVIPTLVSGSADLHGSTKNYLDGLGDFAKGHPEGRNLLFGIREHAMGAIVNGLAYDGIFLASGATFATFADYMRPSVRLSALARLHNFHIWTHDSVGVGEDGPTHQPVEITTALRAIPHLDVLRPGDAEESAGAFVAAVTRTDGPSGLILSRQDLPVLAEIPVDLRRNGVLKGGYVAKKETGTLECILLASGSELQHALAAAKELGDGCRVVSMPCFERFERQPAAYREEVLPSSCRKRIAIEAGVTQAWYRYVGLDGTVIGVDRFGISAPGNTVMEELGITAEAVIAAAR